MNEINPIVTEVRLLHLGNRYEKCKTEFDFLRHRIYLNLYHVRYNTIARPFALAKICRTVIDKWKKFVANRKLERQQQLEVKQELINVEKIISIKVSVNPRYFTVYK